MDSSKSRAPGAGRGCRLSVLLGYKVLHVRSCCLFTNACRPAWRMRLLGLIQMVLLQMGLQKQHTCQCTRSTTNAEGELRRARTGR